MPAADPEEAERTPKRLRSLNSFSRKARLYAREASSFHVANSRFWEATLLPVSIVVVVAFSSCMDLWIGQFISLSCWYATNYYTMGYTLQVLHPSLTSHKLIGVSPFGGPCPLALWSTGLAILETAVYHLGGMPRIAHAVGTTLYGLFGCVWLHTFIAPWQVLPSGWKPHQLSRWLSENRPLETMRSAAPGPSVKSHAHAGIEDFEVSEEAMIAEQRRKRSFFSEVTSSSSKKEPAGGSFAGHLAMMVAGYALLVTWTVAVGGDKTGISAVHRGAVKSLVTVVKEPSHQRERSHYRETRSNASALPSAAYAKWQQSQRQHRQPRQSSAYPPLPVYRPTPLPTGAGEVAAAVGSSTSMARNSADNDIIAAGSGFLRTGITSSTSTSNVTPPSATATDTQKQDATKLAATVNNNNNDHKTTSRTTRTNSNDDNNNNDNNDNNNEMAAAADHGNATDRASPAPKRAASDTSTLDSLAVALHEKPPHQPTVRAEAQLIGDGSRKLQVSLKHKRHSDEGHGMGVHSKPARAWDRVLILGGLGLVLLMLLESGKSYEFSVEYLLCYNIMCLRVPDLLGHWVIASIADMQVSPATATTAISMAYMGSMQAYLIILKRVCQNMSAPDLFPRFHFVAQMYYYLFWYMMLMVVAPGGIQDWSFWILVAVLNVSSLASNAGLHHSCWAALRRRSVQADPPLKVLFDAKIAVQDQLADVVSLMIVPAIATSFHICTSLNMAQYPRGALVSLWQRFGVLLVARLLSGVLTEEIFRRRVELLNKADSLELQLLPIDESQRRQRYMNDIDVGPTLAVEATRNIERCELYFAAVAVACTFAVFQQGDVPARYAFIAFGM